MPVTALPKVKLPSGETVPQLGQGTWRMGESVAARKEEIAALKLGIQYVVFLEARLFSPSADPPRARYAHTYTRAFSSALDAFGCAWMRHFAGDAYVRGYQRTALLLVRFDYLTARWKPTDDGSNDTM